MLPRQNAGANWYNSSMKKLFKFIVILAVIGAILLAGALLTLKMMFPASKVKAMVQQYAQNTWHREVNFADVSFNIIGLTLTDFSLSEPTTFENGTFIHADKVILKVALQPLLHKRLEIKTIGLNGLDITLIKKEDGQFNFDDLLSTPTEDESSSTQTVKQENASALAAILADHIYTTDCNVYYKDLQNISETAITHLDIDIKNFDLASPFQALVKFTTSYKGKTGLEMTLPVELDMLIHLANLDMEQAYLTLQKANTAYKDMQLQLTGSIRNFTRPDIDLNGTLSGVSNKALSDIAPDLPTFVLPALTFKTQASADLEQSAAQITQAKLTAADCVLATAGQISWGGENATYQLQTDVDLNLNQLSAMTTLLDGYGIGGKARGQLQITDQKSGADVRGNIVLNKLAVQYPPVSLSDLDGTIVLAGLANISSEKLTGKLNGEDFTSSFAYRDLSNLSDIVFDMDLSKLKLANFPAGAAPETENSAASSGSPSSEGTEALFNLKSNIQIGEITVPYFTSKGATLKANLQKASSAMKQANGTVSFDLQEGAITDLDSLAKDNKWIKILLLPLNVINKVSNKIGVEVLSAQEDQQKGQIAFSSGSGTYVFTDGVMNVQETHFNSSVSNLTASGNINFPTDALNMQVKASVFKSKTPVSIKIGGTLSNPSGKLDVANTAASLLEGFLTGKTSSGTTASSGTATSTADTAGNSTKNKVDAAASTLKGIGNLLKKKSN